MTAAVLACAVATTSGQEPIAPPAPAPAPVAAPAPTASTDAAVERYLTDHNLHELLATYLLQRLRESDGPERTRLADRLGTIYVDLLEHAKTPEDRQRWEGRSQELLKAVPEAESFELKLNLAKARYLQAEEIAERFRMRLAAPEERQEAERALRTLAATFQEIGTKLNRRVEALEKREGAARDEDSPQVRTELNDVRRLRSLAMYYGGWANTYTAYLGNRPQIAEEAMAQFGWLLNAANGRQPTLERMPANMMRYEHVARAAIGCALCESIRGHDETALRWLEAVENAEGVPPTVAKQVFARRIAVLAAAKRWADLDFLVKRRREPERGKPVQPLETGEARLLAVVALEALQDKGPSKVHDAVQSLADIAMTDLVTRGEVRHVQDLVSKFGTLPLGDEGFIVQYVRGMQAYDHARASHAATGRSVEDPTDSQPVMNQYREAAGLLQTALASEDGARFPDERSNAALMLGLSLFYAGDLVQAADRFEQAHQAASSPKRAEDALWLAIVALDKAIDGGKPSLRERMNGLAAIYLKTFPKSERAAKLLLRQATTGLVSEERAIEILLGVEPSSPLYESARRQAATLLYGAFRHARGADRDFAALRFAEVSEELLRLDRAKATGGNTDQAREATSQIVVRVRQVLDAVLGMSAPDLDRADRAFEVLDAVAGDAGVDLKKVQDELLYRRLQLAVARSRTEEITKSLDKLHAIGGRFSDAADRLLYKRALAALAAASQPPAAREVVRHGSRVIGQFGTDSSALSDPAVYSLYNAVADAAAKVWDAEQDTSMRELAIKLDRILVERGNAPAQVLRRYARLCESSGDLQPALEAWRLLLSGYSTTQPEWFEARFHSLRLLAGLEPTKAREAMNQYKILHPDFGPEPWGPKLQELDRKIGPAAPPEPASGAPSAGGPA